MRPRPIDASLAALKQTLAARPNAVLHAPTGAGKTTRVPLALLDSPWLEARRIVMLEPRRVAARAAARYMAALLGEQVGETVGYRMRLDTYIGAATRIEVVTEGVLTRLLQQDPELSSYGLVIFDEFHERSLQADLGLALVLDAQGALRPDLRLLVMSATLPSERIAAFLDGAPVIASAGRSYAVDIAYLGTGTQRLEPAMANAVACALEEERGGILAFLPGAGEIHRTVAELAPRLPRHVLLAPLHGTLSPPEQERAIEPAPNGQRKVVLATNIAETSLTIEDIRVVVDSGLERVSRFDPKSGMTRLETVSISRASAEQRAGRAGRLAPGVCYRLWNEVAHARLVAERTPEILEADLAPLVLELACWGVADPDDLRWLDAPPAAAYAQARDLLAALKALTVDGRITRAGRDVAGMPVHPRLAEMIRRGRVMHCVATACALAALLGERDILQGADSVDLAVRLELLAGHIQAAEVTPQRLAHVKRSMWQLARGIGSKDTSINSAETGRLIACAYPDRIARRRPGKAPRYKLANGRGAYFAVPEALSNAPWLAIAELDGKPREARIYLAAALDQTDLETHFAARIEVYDLIQWDAELGAVLTRREHRLGALVLCDEPLVEPDREQIIVVLIDGIRSAGSGVLPWTRALRQWQQRAGFLRRVFGANWPDVGDAALMATLEQWLAPYLAGVTRLSQLQTVPLRYALNALLMAVQQRELDKLAPTHVTVPSGARIAIDYGPDNPVLAVRVQEMFGCGATPRIADGRVALTLHLLSPARRPVQVTQDLEGFWRSSYQDVKKDMKGRYPKHPWPDDPLAAEPTRRAKPRSLSPTRSGSKNPDKSRR